MSLQQYGSQGRSSLAFLQLALSTATLLILTTVAFTPSPVDASKARRAGIDATHRHVEQPAAPVLPPSLDEKASANMTLQLERLDWLYDNFNGVAWHALPQRKWKADIKNLTATIAKALCSTSNATLLIPGVYCNFGKIYQVNVAGFGLVGPAAHLNYTSFASYFPSCSFVFSNNALYGELPDDWEMNATVVGLFYADNQLTGRIPDSIWMPNLVNLDFSTNPMLDVSPMPKALGNATSLVYLDFTQVNGSGPVPEEICLMGSLTNLQLVNNKFTSLPECFAPDRKQSIKILNLYANEFSGPIPHNWCNMTGLEQINLSVNKFTGEIPECFSAFTLLNLFSIVNTQMSGTFPTWALQNCTSMQTFELEGFHGPVPDEFDNWQGIELVSLSGPPGVITDEQKTLYGPLPTTLFSSYTLVSVIIENTFLRGQLTGKNFTQTPRLCLIELIENRNIQGTFPTELLTEVWTTKIVPKYGMFSRYFAISDVPISGAIPDLTPAQAKNITDLNVLDPELFQLQFTNIWGWIPDSAALWVPRASQPNWLKGNPKLYYPVQERFLNWTDYFHGHRGALNGVSPNEAFPTTGGINATVSGAFPDAVGYRVAFFDANWTAEQLFTIANTTGADALYAMRVASANATIDYPKVVSQAGYYPTLSFVVPQVPRGTLGLKAMVMLHGAFRSVNRTYALVTTNAASVLFYNPRPTLTGVYPTELRLEGCVPMTLIGHGFTHAPAPAVKLTGSLLSTSSTASSAEIVIDSGVNIVNDTVVTFTLPFANASNFSARYENFTNTEFPMYPVRFMPAGGLRPMEVSPRTSSALVGFIKTCQGGLMPCRFGHEDPFGCPSQPVCTCSTRGDCDFNRTMDYFQCDCDDDFEGGSCDECVFNHYGDSCGACDCEHGSCNWGKSNSGTCNCESGWMGKRCSVSKLAVGLGVGIPVAAGLVGGLGVVLWKTKLSGWFKGDPLSEAERPLT